MKPFSWIVSVVIFLLLYQYKPLKPYLVGIGGILVLGMVLLKYETIRSQFIGVANMRKGDTPPATPTNPASSIYNKGTHKYTN